MSSPAQPMPDWFKEDAEDFHFSYTTKPVDVTIRPIVHVTGSFTQSTSIRALLYHVSSGTIEAFTVTQWINRGSTRDKGIWENFDIFFSLGDANVDNTKLTSLVATDAYALQTSKMPMQNNMAVVDSVIVSGPVLSDRETIAYVEGDRAIVVNSNMSLEDFAKANPGDYIVVAIDRVQ